MANMLPPLNFVGSDRCCAAHIEIAMKNISDVEKIAFMLDVWWDRRLDNIVSVL